MQIPRPVRDGGKTAVTLNEAKDLRAMFSTAWSPQLHYLPCPDRRGKAVSPSAGPYAMGSALTLARRTKRGRLFSLGSWVSPWISGSA